MSPFVKIMFFFFAYRFNRSVVSFIQVLSSYQVYPLFSTGVLFEIFLTLCAFFFNSSGGSVLLILSSILSSCQVHVQFLPFTVGVLPKLYHSYSFLSCFNRRGFNTCLVTKPLGSCRIPCSSY